MFNFTKMQEKIESKLGPFSEKLGNNKVLKSISAGMILTLPLTLGASIFTILGSFPVPSMNNWLVEKGISEHLNAVAGGTLNILALFVVFTISYNYTKLLEGNGVIGGLFSLASFMILMPQTVVTGKTSVSAFSSSYLGSSGLFVAILIAIFIPRIYVFLSKKKSLIIKLPDSVPPMISQSFEPLLVGLILFTIIFILRLIIGYSSFGNLFDLVNKIVAAPLMSVGGSIPVLIIVYMVASLLFTFGIHPSPIQAVMSPITTGMIMATISNINNNEPLKYLSNVVTFDFINNDGTGSTLSLLVCIFLFGKSKRYRTFFKLAFVPNLFNINEPVIFGLPIMFNPILIIPFVLSTLISGVIGWGAVKVGFITTYNASVAMGIPWTLPKFISSFFVYGWQGVALRIIVFAALIALYYPFFKIIDSRELKLENVKIQTKSESQKNFITE